MLRKLHHVAIAVRDADDALGFYRDALGLTVSVDRIMERDGLRGILLPIGESEIELLEPLDSGSGVAKFIEARGPGLHHICFETDDCGKELRRVAERGAQLIDHEPRLGLAGMIGFLHPRSSHGVLVELATPLDEGHSGEEAEGEGIVHGLHEVGIVVRDRRVAVATYARLYDLAAADPSGRIESVGAAVSFLGIGGSRLALLEPDEESGLVSQFASERGEGLCLITLEVSDLPGAVERLRSFGAPCSIPAHSREAFVSPSGTSGVNLRLIEAASSKPHRNLENHG